MSVKRFPGLYALLLESRPSGTNAGTFASGVWNVRQINTIVENDTDIVQSLAAGRFKLKSGEYWVSISAPAIGIGSHRIRLQNVDTDTTEMLGTTDLTQGHQQRCTIRGMLRAINPTRYEVQHRAVNPDFGGAMGAAATLAEEVYTIAEFIRLPDKKGRAMIDASAVGDNTVVAATEGKRIRVLSAVLVASGGANTVRFKSGAAGMLTGQLTLGADGHLVLPLNGFGWFESVGGEALNLELSAGTLVAGALVYDEVE